MNKFYITILFCLMFTGCQPDQTAILLNGDTKINSLDITEKYNQTDSSFKNKYKLENGALKMKVKDDPKDIIRVQIGDDNTTLGAVKDFEPSVTISRWDEVSFKIKPVGLDNVKSKDKNLIIKNNQVKLETPKQDFVMYDLPTSEELPEGGFEYEWILKEKPESNIVEFILESNDVQFWYQAPFTDNYKNGYSEEYKQNIIVTETEIIGENNIVLSKAKGDNYIYSYAIMSLSHKINYTDGKLYKQGKVGQIFRPKIIDSVGNWVWGQLKIEKNILSVTIPQDFLDTAVYPIKHAAGLTLGNTTTGSYEQACVSNGFYGPYVTAASSGTIEKLTARLNADNSGGRYRAVMTFGSNDNIISNGVADRSETFYSTEDWYDSIFPTPPSVTNGTDYCLGTVNIHYGSVFAFDYDSGSGGWYDTSNSFISPTNPTDGSYQSNRYYSIYATYYVAPTSTCTPPASGNWNVNSGDNCYISTDVYVSGDINLLWTGSGSFNIIDGATVACIDGGVLHSTSTPINAESGTFLKCSL